MACVIHLFRTMLCLFVFVSPAWGQAELIESVDNEALEILKRMNDNLLNSQALSFRATETEEEVLDDGQKIMLSKEIRFQMVRPNKFHAQLQRTESELEMFYDGSSFTLFRKDLNFFTTISAPPTNTEVFAKLENRRNIQITAGDVLRDDSYEFITALTNSGFVVGDALVNGVLCTHLAFRLADTDMQIWITKGEQSLPKKYVVTSRWITGAPQYTLTFFDWATQENIDDAVFVFKAPQDSHEIPFDETIPRQEAD